MALSYEQAVKYLFEIPRFTKKMGVSHTAELLTRLGVVREKIPPVVHIAGTNGKGSVCAFLQSISMAAGLQAGMFTSPHLVVPEERIRINGENISSGDFTRIFHRVLEAAGKMEAEGEGHPTFFSFVFAMAMVYFLEQKPDLLLLETGMGGRLDATNACPDTALSVITSIGMDHMEYLGNTLAKIAGEKAGIIREGGTVIALREPEEAAAVIRRTANRLHAALELVPPPGEISMTAGGIEFQDEDGASYAVSLPALYQAENALLAVRAAKRLAASFPQITAEAIESGLRDMRWPARMEEILPGVYVDGAHNLPGVTAFAKSASLLPLREGGRRILLFSAVSDKEFRAMMDVLLQKLAPQTLILTRISNSRGVEMETLGRAALESPYAAEGMQMLLLPDEQEAFTRACSLQRPGDLVFCTGSLYLAGSIHRLRKRG